MSYQYKTGVPRAQGMLVPPRIDEYVSEDNTVRAIDAYVESLDVAQLGFQHTVGGGGAGQPPYAPATLLKLYLWQIPTDFVVTLFDSLSSMSREYEELLFILKTNLWLIWRSKRCLPPLIVRITSGVSRLIFRARPPTNSCGKMVTPLSNLWLHVLPR
jgi:hypothetical protein